MGDWSLQGDAIMHQITQLQEETGMQHSFTTHKSCIVLDRTGSCGVHVNDRRKPLKRRRTVRDTF